MFYELLNWYRIAEITVHTAFYIFVSARRRNDMVLFELLTGNCMHLLGYNTAIAKISDAVCTVISAMQSLFSYFVILFLFSHLLRLEEILLPPPYSNSNPSPIYVPESVLERSEILSP